MKLNKCRQSRTLGLILLCVGLFILAVIFLPLCVWIFALALALIAGGIYLLFRRK